MYQEATKKEVRDKAAEITNMVIQRTKEFSMLAYAKGKEALIVANATATPMLEQAAAQAKVGYKYAQVMAHEVLEWYRQQGGFQGVVDNLWKFIMGEKII